MKKTIICRDFEAFSMKHFLIFLLLSCLLPACDSAKPPETSQAVPPAPAPVQAAAPELAVSGPTSVGGIKIGMSKAEYLKIMGDSPPADALLQDLVRGMESRDGFEIFLLGVFSPEPSKIENIQVDGLSFDLIQTKVEGSVGHKNTSVFFKDRLVRVTISQPKVDVEILTNKYGVPEVIDNMKTEVCQNRIGNKFEYKVGNLDAVWTNGTAKAIFRKNTMSGCSNFSSAFYILEEPEQMKLIMEAIDRRQKDKVKEKVNNSPF